MPTFHSTFSPLYSTGSGFLFPISIFFRPYGNKLEIRLSRTTGCTHTRTHRHTQTRRWSQMSSIVTSSSTTRGGDVAKRKKKQKSVGRISWIESTSGFQMEKGGNNFLSRSDSIRCRHFSMFPPLALEPLLSFLSFLVFSFFAQNVRRTQTT